LIWHIYEPAIYTNSANSDESKPLVKLMQADGLNDLITEINYGDAGDPFPGTSGKLVFNSLSNPNSKLYNNTDSLVQVSNISSTCAEVMTADLEFTGPLTFFQLNIPLVMGTSTSLPNPVLNPGFEAGSDGSWFQGSSSGLWIITRLSDYGIPAHSGDWGAWLGGMPNDHSTISQSSINRHGMRYMHYWYWISSADTCGHDFAYFYFGSGSPIFTINLCSTTNSGGWVEGVLDLNNYPYLGDGLAINFTVMTDGTENSNFLLDDISVSYSPIYAPTRDEDKSYLETITR